MLDPLVSPESSGTSFDSSPNATALAAVDEAARAIAGVGDLEDVLQLIVDRVRDLVGASYAALGIAAPDGRMERFITSGIDPHQRHAIGPLPEGRGLLGLIIREARAYRIPSIADHPDSSGFPANHPPMTSFLGVPITRQGNVDRKLLPDRQDRRERVLAGRPGARRALRPPRLDRHRQRATPRTGTEAGRHRGARPDRTRPARRDHPGALRGRPVARGRARADDRETRRSSRTCRCRHRVHQPLDPRHPQLHLRAAAGGGRRQRVRRGPRCSSPRKSATAGSSTWMSISIRQLTLG